MGPSVADLRRRFPAIARAKGWALMENAGGSQVPEQVIEAIRRYMTENYVQLGAGYPLSQSCDSVVAAGHRVLGTMMGAAEWEKEIVIGGSSSQLFSNLASAFADVLRPGDEVVVSSSGHEANVGCWLKAAERSGATVKWWRPALSGAPGGGPVTCPVPALRKLLGPRTRVVAFPHVSNLLGEVVDIKAVAAAVKVLAPGARTVADGVAHAPHQLMHCHEWGVDFYAFSCYKVFGPHCAALYGRKESWKGLQGPNHYFVDGAETVYKWELGGAPHEACAGLVGVGKYLSEVAGAPPGQELTREVAARAFARFTELEAELTAKFIQYLRSKPGVTIVGPGSADHTVRHATISFIHSDLTPEQITAACHRGQVAMRWGHMYSPRVLEDLGLSEKLGVARVSMLHYNTTAEVDRLCAALDTVLPGKAKM
eukprot:TRINITY_DN12344_c1_g1_i1.p1 TRINITY_DN12344_c1_g1~~TRINITY_DN12344_c1_g1_i1.p1  ORF type:complete len:454 (+),score=128.57 TRINITY_DN12344_c1_g1_i1:85-1362(+)